LKFSNKVYLSYPENLTSRT